MQTTNSRASSSYFRPYGPCGSFARSSNAPDLRALVRLLNLPAPSARLLQLTPRLRVRRVRALLADLPDFAHLQELELCNATRATVALLARVHLLRALRVHC